MKETKELNAAYRKERVDRSGGDEADGVNDKPNSNDLSVYST